MAKRLLVYGVRYELMDDALAELKHISQLHDEGHLGRYDAAVVSMDEDGQVMVANVDSTSRSGGAGMGAVAGAIVGVIFPPSILAGAAVGAATGGLAGTVAKRFGGDELRELGELLEPGQSGLLLVTDWLDEPYRPTLFNKALSERSTTIDADDDLVQAIEDEAERGR